MSTHQHSVDSISLHDCFSANGTHGLPDSVHAEMAAAFPEGHGQYTAAEEEQMYDAYQARVAEVSEPSTVVECRVQLSDNLISITYPDTGRTVSVPMTAAPVDMCRRIVYCKSRYLATVPFTAAELQAFAACVPEVADSTEPAAAA